MSAEPVEPKESIEPGPRRIVAVGDIHGALEPFRLILRQAELIDEKDRWIGGSATLVQTGDFLDRGAGAAGAADLLQRLQKEAEAAGGQVIVLLGNHETLNLTMDLRDVTPQIVEPFARKRSERKQRSHCRLLFDRLSQKRNAEAVPSRSEHNARCAVEIPVGWLEYIEALGPDEPLGKWLRSLPVAVEIDGWIFLHGGLSPAYAKLGLDEVNARVREDIARFDRLRSGLLYRDLITVSSGLREIVGVGRALHLVMEERGTPIKRPPLKDLERAKELVDWAIFDPEGPLWFRGYANWTDEEGTPEVEAVLRETGARGVIVGHTPQKSRSIRGRFDGKIWLIDTGMLAEVYRGRPAALEIVGGRIAAIYPDGRELLWPSEPSSGASPQGN